MSVCAYVCSRQSIKPLSSSASRMKKNTTHAQPSLNVSVGYTLSHTLLHAHTAMPTCLSVRFYHHRDTVDSSFVCAEKIGVLRSQNTTFIMIYKGCGYASVCVFCVLVAHRERVKDENYWWNRKACVFVSAFVPQHLFLCFDVPGSV